MLFFLSPARRFCAGRHKLFSCSVSDFVFWLLGVERNPVRGALARGRYICKSFGFSLGGKICRGIYGRRCARIFIFSICRLRARAGLFGFRDAVTILAETRRRHDDITTMQTKCYAHKRVNSDLRNISGHRTSKIFKFCVILVAIHVIVLNKNDKSFCGE